MEPAETHSGFVVPISRLGREPVGRVTCTAQEHTLDHVSTCTSTDGGGMLHVGYRPGATGTFRPEELGKLHQPLPENNGPDGMSQ